MLPTAIRAAQSSRTVLMRSSYPSKDEAWGMRSSTMQAKTSRCRAAAPNSSPALARLRATSPARNWLPHSTKRKATSRVVLAK